MQKNLLFLLVFLFSLLISSQTINAQTGGLKDSKVDATEDFETGDFSQYDWTFGGDADWFITDGFSYEGVYSAQSGDVNDYQASELILDYEVYAEDTLSFWYKVSSEPNYDYLRFYIDGVEMDEWAGEVNWSYAEYVVSPGMHTFKWAYEKDVSISNGLDAALIDMITFPPMEIEAIINSDTAVICQNDSVMFEDASVGPITQWLWYFEGGTPETATVQNPVVAYTTPGSFDVSLEVSDGVEISFINMEDFITVGTTPGAPGMPAGISLLCASWGSSTYTVNSLPGISTYQWTINPSEAGTISGNGSTNITVLWSTGWLGTAELSVAGVNYCGNGDYSTPLSITRYLPEVYLYLVPYVALEDPPIELSGGYPEGGEYTGPGVTDGWFDPSVAGLGEHTITYTYTDINFCANTAEDIITVTPNVGIQSILNKEGVNIYPNPNTGNFTLRLNIGNHNNVNIQVFDALNKLVFKEENKSIENGNEFQFDFDHFAEGLYYIKLTSNDFNYVEKLVIKK